MTYARWVWLLRDVRCIVLHRRWLIPGRFEPDWHFCRRCRRWL